MKLDGKLFFLTAVSFVAGFLACLVMVSSTSKPRPIVAGVTAVPTMTLTQIQPQPFHIVKWPIDMVWIQNSEPRVTAPPRITRDPLDEIEMMKHRSVDLIDTRAQP